MSHYKPYKDSRPVDGGWFARVPAAWTVCKLSFRYTVDLGKMLDEKRITGTHLTPYLRNQDVQWGSISTDDLPVMDIAPEEFERYTVCRGDLLVCEGGDVGRAALWQGIDGGVGYQKALHRLRPRNASSDDPEFMFYLLAAAKNEGAFEESDAKATISHLPAEKFRQYRFPFPPIAEQRLIVQQLRLETARIDALMARKTRFIELLREKRQALITHAVTKGLDSEVPMKESGVEWLGQIPEHWTLKPLKLVVKPGSSVTYGIVQPGDAQEEGVPFIQTTNMSSGNFDLTKLQRTTPEIAAAYPRSSLVGGEVVLGIRASIGAAYVVPSHLAGVNLSRGVARIDCTHEIDSGFLVQYLRSHAVGSYWELSKQGSTFNEVSIETVRELPVIVPPIGEQREISTTVTQGCARLDQLMATTERSITLLKTRRAALITAAVTGQIDLRREAEAQEALQEVEEGA